MLKNKNNDYRIYLISTFLIIGYMSSNNLLFLGMMIMLNCIGIMLGSREERIGYLIYWTPWIPILKMNPNSPSCFVILVITYIISSIFQKDNEKIKINHSNLILYLLLVAYILIISLANKKIDFIFIIGFILMYGVLLLGINQVKSKKYEEYLDIYAFSTLISSVVAYLGLFISDIKYFIENMQQRSIEVFDFNNKYSRFSGLESDPNYLAIHILLALCILIILYIRTDKKKYLIFMLILSYFGLITQSKMFLILFIFIIMFVILVSIINQKINKKKCLKVFILIIFILGLISTFLQSEIYNIYITRFLGKGTSISSITTGRFDIWKNYLEYFDSDLKTLVFGNGLYIHGVNGRYAHNMYIYMVYLIGIVGTTIYMIYIYSLYKHSKKNKTTNKNILSINYLPLYVMIISNLSLDSFVFDFFPMQIFIIIVASALSD